jgi:hypothetical protein
MNTMLFAYYTGWILCILAGIALLVELVLYWIEKR